MGLSRHTGHVGSAVVQGASERGGGATGGKRSVNGVCWWVCAKGVGGRSWRSGVRPRGTVLVSTR